MIEQEINVIEQPRFSTPREFVRKRSVRRLRLQEDLDQVFCGELRYQIMELPEEEIAEDQADPLDEVELTTEQRKQDILNVMRLN